MTEGLTDCGVAGRLFLSPHTVDFHLGQIFRKPDINSGWNWPVSPTRSYPPEVVDVWEPIHRMAN